MRSAAAFPVLGSFLLAVTLSADSSVNLRPVAGGYLLVPVVLNGTGPFEFLLDTGTTTTFLDPKLASQLALPMGRSETLVSLAAETRANRVRVESLRLESWEVRDVDLLAADLGAVRQLDPDVRGVLGNDILGQRSFLLSNASKRIEIDLDGSLSRRITGREVPLRTVKGTRVVEVGISGVARPFLLIPDSACLQVVLFERLRGEFREIDGGGSAALLQTALGTKRTSLRRLSRLRFAGGDLRNLDVVVLQEPAAFADRAEDGLLPTSLFREVFFDRDRGLLVLDPRAVGAPEGLSASFRRRGPS